MELLDQFLLTQARSQILQNFYSNNVPILAYRELSSFEHMSQAFWRWVQAEVGTLLITIRGVFEKREFVLVETSLRKTAYEVG